jgi:5-hydroxyisourate hydrolase-like protein (transthyretin family)
VADGTHLTSVDVYLTDATNSISGTIRYAGDAAGIGGATVEFFDAAGDGSAPVDSVVTEADGSYTVADLPYGTYRVRASADPGVYATTWYTGVPTFAEAYDLVLADGTHLTSIDIYLTDAPPQPHGDLSGTIRDGATGDGVAGATVDLFDSGGDGTTPIASVGTDADGTYEFLDLTPGSYRLRASAAGMVDGWYAGALDFNSASDIHVSAGSQLTGYHVDLWSTASGITGRVLAGESDDPLAGADVGLFDATGDGTAPIATTTADAEGRYAFTDVADGSYRVRASIPGRVALWYGGADFAGASDLWIAGSTHLTDIDIRLWETQNSVSGTLREFATGNPVAGATVELHPSDSEPGDPITAVTGVDGSYSISDLAEGLYAVRFIGGSGELEQPWYVNAFALEDAALVYVGTTSHLTGIDGNIGQPYTFTVTGVPHVTGTPEVGAVLSVDPGTWSPVPDSFTYQWLRNGAEIPGANGATYTVQEADRGRTISVNVLAVLPGFDGGLQGSNQVFIPAATAADIAAALDVDATMQVSLFGAASGVATSDASFTGFPRAGGDYAVLSSGYATDVMLPAEPDVGLSTTLGNGAGIDGNDLSGVTVAVEPPTGANCLAVDLKFGSEEYPEWVGSAFNDVFTAETPSSDISKSGDVIEAPNNYAFDAAGNILSINAIVGFAPVAGNAMDGWTPGLTARIPLVDGDNDVILTIQDIGDSSLDSAVLLDNVRYVPTVECADGGGATSTEPIVGTTPVITGDVSACTTVTAEPGTWEPAPVDLAYQWRVDGVDVDGATDPTWQVPPAAVGHAITVVVTGTRTGYLPVSLESSPATVEACSLDPGTPQVSGIATVGETLTADPGEWAPDPVELSIEWLRDGLPIAGATGTEYVLVEADLGAMISVRVTGSKLGYATAARESDAIGPVGPADEPETLTISGTILDGFTGEPVVGATVSAFAADGTGGVPLASAVTATDGTYALGPLPAQAYRVSAAADGYATVWYLSELDFASAADVGSDLGGEAFASMTMWASATGVSGTVREWSTDEPLEGVEVSLHPLEPPDSAAVDTETTDADGRYRFADPAPGSYVVRFSDGAREEWYSAAAFREGATTVVVETGSQLVAVDGALGRPVEFDQTPKPVIVGTLEVGSVLGVDLGTWVPVPDSFEYEWYRNGQPITGATGATYTVTLADRGTELSVRVTAFRPGYSPASVTSDPIEIPAVTAGDFGRAIDLDGGMSVALEGDGAGYAIGTAPIGPFPGVGEDYGVLSTGNAGAVLMPAEPDAFLSTDLDGPTGVDGHDLVRATITVAPPGGSGCLAIDFQFGSEEFPEYVGSSFNDVFTIETPASDITLDGGTIVAPNNYALDIDGRVISINSIVEFAPLAGNALDGWTAGLTAFVPVSGAEAQVILTIQDLGDDAFDSAVILDGVRFESASACSGGGGVIPTDPITGPTPEVSGEATACGVLEVDPGVWAPAPVTLAIQWLLDGEPVDGATATEFAVPADAVGSEVTVEVAGSKPGYPDVTMTSPGLGIVACALSPTPTPVISGDAVVGGTLTVDPGTWGPAPVDLAYQWLRDGEPIAGADGTELVLGPDDVGASITVAVTGSKPGYEDATRTSDPAGPVAAAQLTPTPIPVVTGTASVGGTLTVDAGTWGPAPVQLSIRWLRDGVPIDGADGSDLVLIAADAGAMITAEVTGVKSGYATVSRTSEPVGPIVVPALDPAPVPTITGEPRVGSTLTAAPGTWGPAPVALAYQWLRDGTPIPDATSSTYTLQAADLDTTIAVTVTGSKAGYQGAERTSTGVGPVEAGTLTAPTPTISGVVAVGSVLTVVPGTWGPAPVQLTYQWFVGGSPRDGATSTTYIPTSADVGFVITVAVTGTKPGYTTVTRTSAATITVPTPTPPPPPTLTAPTPTISGTPVLGNTLTVITGTWGPAPVALAIQWLRNGSPIGGATGLTYVLGSQDVGAMMSVRVTGTKTGYVTAVRTSAQVGPVTLRPFDSAPTPTISGTTRVANVLTANPGAWVPTPTKLTYQWYRNGAAIPGATSSTWLLNGADFDRRIHVVVTAERNGYVTTSRASAQTPNILPGFMTATPKPWISGQAKVGSTLRVHTGQWEPAPVPVIFTWRRDGVPIPGQSGGSDFWTYTLRPADAGHRITVTVQSVKTGYVSVTQVTDPTAVVTNKK